MTAIVYDNQFNRVQKILNQMQWPVKGVKSRLSFFYKSINVNCSLFFQVKKVQKAMENYPEHKDEFKPFLKDIKKSRDVLYQFDKELEEYNIPKIIHYNIHSSLIRLDDLVEDLEIFVDDEIQELGEKIAHSL